MSIRLLTGMELPVSYVESNYSSAQIYKIFAHRHDGEELGFASIDIHECKLRLLMIHNAAQRKNGIGSQLFVRAAMALQRFGCADMYWQSVEDAYGFYLKQGARFDDRPKLLGNGITMSYQFFHESPKQNRSWLYNIKAKEVAELKERFDYLVIHCRGNKK